MCSVCDLNCDFYSIKLSHPRGFTPECKEAGLKLVKATLCVYKEAMLKLLPTPTKSHYLFNLRDFARVIQGVLLSAPVTTPDPDTMKKLWTHEVLTIPMYYICQCPCTTYANAHVLHMPMPMYYVCKCPCTMYANALCQYTIPMYYTHVLYPCTIPVYIRKYTVAAYLSMFMHAYVHM